MTGAEKPPVSSRLLHSSQLSQQTSSAAAVEQSLLEDLGYVHKAELLLLKLVAIICLPDEFY